MPQLDATYTQHTGNRDDYHIEKYRKSRREGEGSAMQHNIPWPLAIIRLCLPRNDPIGEYDGQLRYCAPKQVFTLSGAALGCGRVCSLGQIRICNRLGAFRIVL